MKANKVIIAITVFIFIVVIYLSHNLYQTIKTDTVKQFNEHQLLIARMAAVKLETYLSDRTKGIALMTSLDDLQTKDLSKIKKVVDYYYNQIQGKFVKSVSVYDDRGSIVYSTMATAINRNYNNSTFFNWAKMRENKGKVFITSLIRMGDGETTSLPYFRFILASPFYNNDKNTKNGNIGGQFAGVFSISVDLHGLLDTTINFVDENNQNTHFWVMDTTGALLFASEHPEMITQNVKMADESCIECHDSFNEIFHILQTKQGAVEYETKGEPKKIAAFATVSYANIEWRLVVNSKFKAATVYIDNALKEILLLLLVFTGALIAGSTFLYRTNIKRRKAQQETKYLLERQILEEEIAESEEQYRYLFVNNPMNMWVYDVETLKILKVNEAAIAHYGYTEKEFLSMTLLDIRPEEDRDALLENIKNATDKYQESTNWKHKTKDGTIIDVDIISHQLPESFGVNHRLVMAVDITERKRAEEAFRVSESKYRKIFENVYDVFYQTDVHGIILDISPSIERISGYTREELLQKDIRILYFNPEDRTGLLQQVYEKGQIVGYEIQLVTKNKTMVYISVNTHLLYEGGVVVGIEGSISDITEKKKAQEELIQSKEKAEEMSRLKSSFLANMSHELRTPMIGILGYSEILCDISGEKEILDIAHALNKSGQRLMNTLNLILDLSRIEAGKLEIEKTDVNIISVIEEVVELFLGAAKMKSITLELESKFTQLIIRIDTKLFSEIITNLVNNAVKYTFKGGVKIKVDVETLPEANWLKIQIIDTGIGIDKTNQTIIWDEFRQVSEGLNRHFEGTGIGLSLTKRYVQKLSGTITVESEYGKGSTFCVRFPM